MEHRSEPEHGLKYYLRIVRKRIWILIVLFVVCTTSTAIVSYRMTPVYRATAFLRIEKRTPNIVGIKDIYEIDTRADDYYETQYRLLTSRTICSEVFEKLSLAKLDRYANDREPVASFVDDVIVEPVSGTYLVNVSYESDNPMLAADVANAIADEYVSSIKREKKAISQETENKITTQIPALRQRLVQSQSALLSFEEENSALSFRKRREIIYSTLSSLNAQITMIDQEIAAAKASAAVMWAAVASWK